MTPKERAAELYSKVYVQTPTRWTELEIEEDKRFSKQCALIAVDELIKTHNEMQNFLLSEIGYLITSPEYWQEVKQEIEKL